MEIKNYIELHKSRFVEELFSLIRIPSVSAHAHRQPEIKQCAERWKDCNIKFIVLKAIDNHCMMILS